MASNEILKNHKIIMENNQEYLILERPIDCKLERLVITGLYIANVDQGEFIIPEEPSKIQVNFIDTSNIGYLDLEFNFEQPTVTASITSGLGTITPISQQIEYGSVANVTISPDVNYEIDSVIGCGGSLVNNVYTTGIVTSSCHISVGFILIRHTVTASSIGFGTITPETQQIEHGSIAIITITPDENYEIGSVTGCGGILVDNVYTTGEIIEDCHVSVEFIEIAIQKSLYTTGDNYNGQLGIGDFTDKINYNEADITGDWVDVQCGHHNTIVLNSSGEIWGCGYWNKGMLGNIDVGVQDYLWRKVSTENNWVKISVGSYHVLAINSNGELYSWGENSNSGALGLGYYGTPDVIIPTRIGTASNWVSIAAGQDTSMAINSLGELFACGRNTWGQIGLGYSIGGTEPNTYKYADPDRAHTLTQIGIGNFWVQASCGESVSTAITNTGELWVTAGDNSYGSNGLGEGQEFGVWELTRVGTASNWVLVHCGVYQNTLAINSLGELYGCGDNWSGLLGTGDTDNRYTMTRIGSASNWLDIGGTGYSNLIINNQNELFGAGWNGDGELGLGDTTPRHVFTKITSPNKKFIKVAGGREHSVVITDDSI